ncbi:MAG TPA: serine protein kinase PrkA [Polyangiaceae bacterium]
MDKPGERALAHLEKIATTVESRFREGRRVLSFQEYLELFATDPVRFSRDAARYMRDMFDFYGTSQIERPWGTLTRYRLFDLPWEAEGNRRDALVGQEEVQGELYRVLSNFAQEGRPNKLILLHGPNGSSKSTIASCLMRALEHYATTDEGALYRFHWVFPSQKTIRGSIGFGGTRATGTVGTSYAHLDEDQIDARLFIEIRDHPLFLLPVPQRRQLIDDLYPNADRSQRPPDWLLRGRLSHKSQQVFEALLSSYKGSLAEVLRHVQVERYFISQRYRTGAVTVGPQMSVDAGERQITADRSVAALPTSLKATTLFEAYGELIEAAGGLLEFSDLLKRPLDAFKYLQISIETGEAALPQQTVQLNCVMMGSANEVHLGAFREHPEFASFRGRLEMVRAPYLRSYLEEKAIYDAQIAPQVQRHVAPHATEIAAMFGALTRMRKPNPDRYPRALASVVSSLTALEKMDLFAWGITPERLDPEAQKLLKANVEEIYRESEIYPIYEGRIGASPREMRTVLLDAGQSKMYKCLSPLAVLSELDELCERVAEYEWLQEEQLAGGYHDHKAFREVIRGRLLDSWEAEMRVASGLVSESQYGELFDRYVSHVSVWVKKEKVRNRLTGAYEEPDERMMGEVEALLGVKGDATDYRRGLISAIAAWAIDHPDTRVDNTVVFASQTKKLRDAVFAERRTQVAEVARDMMYVLSGQTGGMNEERKSGARAAIERMKQSYEYCEECVRDTASSLVRWRYAELVN